MRLGRQARLRSLNFILGVRGNLKAFMKGSDKLRLAILAFSLPLAWRNSWVGGPKQMTGKPVMKLLDQSRPEGCSLDQGSGAEEKETDFRNKRQNQQDFVCGGVRGQGGRGRNSQQLFQEGRKAFPCSCHIVLKCLPSTVSFQAQFLPISSTKLSLIDLVPFFLGVFQNFRVEHF